jgi:TonB family protein
MKAFLLVLFFSIFTLFSFGAKTYTLTVNVYSLATGEPISGAEVTTVIKKSRTIVGVTDSLGSITISNIRHKLLSLEVFVQNGIYRIGSFSHYNTKRTDESKDFYLRLNEVEEEKAFIARDKRYKNDTSHYVKQMRSGKSPALDNGSIEFEPASFVGEPIEFFRFLQRNVVYPDYCMRNEIQGKVYLSFMVQKDGTITNVIVEKGVHKELDEEAVRVISYSPKWNPAMSDGKPIKAKVKTSVTFAIAG